MNPVLKGCWDAFRREVGQPLLTCTYVGENCAKLRNSSVSPTNSGDG